MVISLLSRRGLAGVGVPVITSVSPCCRVRVFVVFASPSLSLCRGVHMVATVLLGSSRIVVRFVSSSLIVAGFVSLSLRCCLCWVCCRQVRLLISHCRRVPLSEFALLSLLGVSSSGSSPLLSLSPGLSR